MSLSHKKAHVLTIWGNDVERKEIHGKALSGSLGADEFFGCGYSCPFYSVPLALLYRTLSILKELCKCSENSIWIFPRKRYYIFSNVLTNITEKLITYIRFSGITEAVKLHCTTKNEFSNVAYRTKNNARKSIELQVQQQFLTSNVEFQNEIISKKVNVKKPIEFPSVLSQLEA
ncbi:hypothetical protein WA026_006988 [Henosepilachna vigintioctopunctata]|uniref:Uncharacterized protein n=1 Tax=Henosepilachna vigintioctopunctata TaxID=420089 RepID=A0AAW1V8Z7_9CUCU